MVEVKIPADLSCTGKEKWKEVAIDSCIAAIVEALQKGGINMRASCCGHNNEIGIDGYIYLQDRRVLIIKNPDNEMIKTTEAKKLKIGEWLNSLFWRKHTSHYETAWGKLYAEWEQRGGLIRNHKIYRLAGAK